MTKTAGVGLALAAVVACSGAAPAPQASPPPAPQASPAPSRVLAYTEQRLLATDSALEPPAYPVRTNPDGSWLTKGADDWTAGFYAAALWKTYERTRDPAWRRRAEIWQAGLAPETAHDDTIDALMNLELMFWAGQNGGKPEYAAMAQHPALRTLQDLVRPDGGTWMFGGYNQDTGALERHYTEQGFATESTWARGQAWAVHGFTMAYRYTRDARFLDGARRTADYFVRHLPPDQVPYWDFDAPDKATAPRDTSASAITASALLEPRFAAMLQHGTQHLPHHRSCRSDCADRPKPAG